MKRITMVGMVLMLLIVTSVNAFPKYELKCEGEVWDCPPIPIDEEEDEETEEEVYIPPRSSDSKPKWDLDNNRILTIVGKSPKMFKCNNEIYHFEHHLLWDKVLDKDMKPISSPKVKWFTNNEFKLNNCTINYETEGNTAKVWKVIE